MPTAGGRGRALRLEEQQPGKQAGEPGAPLWPRFPSQGRAVQSAKPRGDTQQAHNQVWSPFSFHGTGALTWKSRCAGLPRPLLHEVGELLSTTYPQAHAGPMAIWDLARDFNT